MSDSAKEKLKNLVNHNMYGKKHSEETKEKMKKAHIGEKKSIECKRKHQILSKDRVWISNEKINKFVKNYELDEYLNNGWKIGRNKLKPYKYNKTRK